MTVGILVLGKIMSEGLSVLCSHYGGEGLALGNSLGWEPLLSGG